MVVSGEEVCGNDGSNLSLGMSDWDCMFLKSVYIRYGILINAPALVSFSYYEVKDENS